jgi:zinc transport system substrate-binding protein
MGTILVGCVQVGDATDTSSKATKNTINIVATIFPIYDFSRAIVGDKANLSMLVSAGTSIHSYDPSPTDIIKIQKADVFIYISGESDEWVDRVLGSMDISKKKIIKLMDCVSVVEEETVEGMETEKTNEESKEEIEYDEHIWTSTKNAVKMTNAISDTLCIVDSANAQIYKQNAKAYADEIEKVHAEIQNIVDNSRVKMIIMGDKFPFRYFADEFGLEYRAAFNGCSSETEASANTIAYLIDAVKKNKISTVFYIELSNKNIAQAISEHTGAKMLELNSCQNILKSDFEKGVTYVSIMKQNAQNLKMGFE